MTNRERAESISSLYVNMLIPDHMEDLRSMIEDVLDEAEKRGQQALLDGTTDNTFLEIYGYTIKQIRQMDVWMKERNLKLSVIDKEVRRAGDFGIDMGYKQGKIEGQRDMLEKMEEIVKARISEAVEKASIAGQKSMRERAAKIADAMGCRNVSEKSLQDCGEQVAEDIRALPIEGE